MRKNNIGEIIIKPIMVCDKTIEEIGNNICTQLANNQDFKDNRILVIYDRDCVKVWIDDRVEDLPDIII